MTGTGVEIGGFQPVEFEEVNNMKTYQLQWLGVDGTWNVVVDDENFPLEFTFITNALFVVKMMGNLAEYPSRLDKWLIIDSTGTKTPADTFARVEV